MKHKNKLEKKISRRIGGRIHNHNVDGANDFIKFICNEKFSDRFNIAFSILRGKPIKLRKVIL